jgi:hypothetical protein
MADLGRWLGEEYRFSRPVRPDEVEELLDPKDLEH